MLPTTSKLVLVATITALVGMSSPMSISSSSSSSRNPPAGCQPSQIRVRRQCYNKTGLFSACQVNEQCQSLDGHSFCGFPDDDHHLSRHECICEEGYHPQKDINGVYLCTPIHRCSTEHFNAEYLAGDCPLAHEYCARNVCLCEPNYRREAGSGGECRWSVPDRPEPTGGDAQEGQEAGHHWAWWQGSLNSAEVTLIALLISAIIVAFVIAILAILLFCCPRAPGENPSTTQSRSTASGALNRNHTSSLFASNHHHHKTRQPMLFRENSASQRALISSNY